MERVWNRTSPEIESQISNMYLSGLSSTEIGKQFNYNGNTTVCRILQRLNIEMRNKRHDPNESFFIPITRESAWVYGWFLGDAGICKDRIRLEILKKDEEVLQNIKDLMGLRTSINYRKRPLADERFVEFAYFSVCSPSIRDEFNKLTIDQVEDRFIPDFVRGFFEAEGCVLWSKNRLNKHGGALRTIIAQKDKKVLDYILGKLRQLSTVKKGTIYSDSHGCHMLQFGIMDSISLYHYLYDNCGNLFLGRKRIDTRS